MNILNVKI